MQDKKMPIVGKGSNHIIITTKSARHESAKERKEARKNAPRVVIYGMNEKEYERFSSIYNGLHKETAPAKTLNLRHRLIRNAIREALRKRLFGEYSQENIISVKKK